MTYNNYYKQKVVFGTYQFGSGDNLLGLLQMEATGFVLRKAESQTHFISSMRVDDEKIKVIKNDRTSEV
jgi:hypothetical protein